MMTITPGSGTTVPPMRVAIVVWNVDTGCDGFALKLFRGDGVPGSGGTVRVNHSHSISATDRAQQPRQSRPG
jgi:hypothetical protein